MATIKKLVNFFHDNRVDVLILGLIDRLLGALVKKFSAKRRPKTPASAPRTGGKGKKRKQSKISSAANK